ncbi:MAG: threonine--tRNA ligase, partial [Spirochaetaceae bacterium]|nr:threonine--tRNA ligase [Spirochaetaceae bacterium]
MLEKNEKLNVVRHSTSHVMAEAILKLFPGTKVAIGPAIDNGFYYDFEFPKDTKFSETDFANVEKEMRKIISGNHDFIRKEVSKEEALKLFADQPYKIELINDLPAGETISTYEQDGFLDLCRGPHVDNTKEINAQAFKLNKIAGAYWRGDSNRPMLTRV